MRWLFSSSSQPCFLGSKTNVGAEFSEFRSNCVSDDIFMFLSAKIVFGHDKQTTRYQSFLIKLL